MVCLQVCHWSCRELRYHLLGPPIITPPSSPHHVCRLNIQNMNRQARLYHQGLVPIIRVVPGRGLWERLRENVQCEVSDGCSVRSVMGAVWGQWWVQAWHSNPFDLHSLLMYILIWAEPGLCVVCVCVCVLFVCVWLCVYTCTWCWCMCHYVNINCLCLHIFCYLSSCQREQLGFHSYC